MPDMRWKIPVAGFNTYLRVGVLHSSRIWKFIGFSRGRRGCDLPADLKLGGKWNASPSRLSDFRRVSLRGIVIWSMLPTFSPRRIQDIVRLYMFSWGNSLTDICLASVWFRYIMWQTRKVALHYTVGDDVIDILEGIQNVFRQTYRHIVQTAGCSEGCHGGAQDITSCTCNELLVFDSGGGIVYYSM